MDRIPYRKRMRRLERCCAVLALWAYDGTRVARGKKRRLSVYQMGAAMGPQTQIYGPCDRPRYMGIFGFTEDRQRAFIVYIQSPAGSDREPPPVCMWSRRLILLLWDDFLYKDGHAIVVWPPSDDRTFPQRRRLGLKDRWAVRDPWGKSGKAFGVNRRQLGMLIAGSTYILY